jgi:hypothetical protein
MRRTTFLALLAAVTALLAPAAPPPADSQPAPRGPVLVGIYDNRAIAVAYAASAHNPVGARMQEYEAAKLAGDAARMQELEAWGQKHQRQLHRQGFGRVPVDDLLACVRDGLPEVARAAGVDAITWSCAYAAPGVEVVDVTHRIVALFDPSPATLRTISQMKGVEPLDLDAIEAQRDH